MKKLILLFITLGIGLSANAGGLLTNTNQSAGFLRNMARGTTLSPDAVYYNPAGTVFMTKGWHLGIGIQEAVQRRITYSKFAPFAMSAKGDGSQEKEYIGKAFSPFIPSIHLVYKTPKVALMGSFGIGGGGGSAHYSEGLASFESLVAQIPAILQSKGIPTTKYDADLFIKGTTYTFSFQVGAAFKITDWLAAAVQVRGNFTYQKYEGHLKSIMINPQHPLLNPTGAMIPATDFFQAAGAANPAFAPYAALTADKELHTVQRGVSISPVFALAMNKGGWMSSIRYEGKKHMTLKNHTTKDVTLTEGPMYPDGEKIEEDIPAILAVAASRQIGPVKVAAQWNHYFDKDANNSFKRKGTVKGDTNEYILGVEWDVTDRIIAGTSSQLTKYNLNSNNYSDMGFNNSSVSWGIGLGYKLNKMITLNGSFMKTFYKKVTKESDIYNSNIAALPGSDVYHRKSLCYGIGIDINF